eukprot:SAG22_NODE_8471_length_653_cov_1.808664_1_plen_143_part_10
MADASFHQFDHEAAAGDEDHVDRASTEPMLPMQHGQPAPASTRRPAMLVMAALGAILLVATAGVVATTSSTQQLPSPRSISSAAAAAAAASSAAGAGLQASPAQTAPRLGADIPAENRCKGVDCGEHGVCMFTGTCGCTDGFS